MRRVLAAGVSSIAVLMPCAPALASSVPIPGPPIPYPTLPDLPANFNVTVFEDTPNQALSGTYATGDPQSPTGYQQGYIYADQTGAEACNGSPTTLSRHTPIAPLNGAGQGYVWVGQSHAPSRWRRRGAPAPRLVMCC